MFVNEAARRRAAFLSEIGVGPQWTLRHRPYDVPAAGQDMDEKMAEPAGEGAIAAAPEVLVEAGMQGVALAASGAPPVSAWSDNATPPALAVTDEEIARMSWPQLKAAVANCTRCNLCGERRAAVFGSGDPVAQWMIVAGAPNLADQSEGRLFAGDAGKLLSNMLLAIGLAPGRNVYFSSLVRGRAVDDNGADRAPTAQEATACRPYLEREIVLTKAVVILAAGQAAANGLLSKAPDEPLAAARGTLHRIGSAALVATHHPADLLHRGLDKEAAWADLCLAKTVHGKAG